jgi:replication factor A1
MANIQLTENFFQEFAEDPNFANPQPILQINQSRKLDAAAQICVRLRCSDGIFSYSNCGFDKSLADRVDEILSAEEEKCPVIKVLSYRPVVTNEKSMFIITDYELVAKNVDKIGNPKAHTGDPKTFQGFGGAKRRLDENMQAYSGTPTPKKMTKVESGGPVMPINGISPYISGRWRIGGTATDIEGLRNINSKKGPMKVFSFILTDKSGKSIKITSFAETAEKFHPQLQENGSYYISGGPSCIRPANKKFNSTGHDYEITLSHDSLIEMAEEQTYEAPKIVLHKVSLDTLSQHSGQSVDILAMIDKVEDAVTIRKKDNTETLRRNVQLIDQSATSVTLTLWGDHAQSFAGEEGRALGIKNAFVREYMGTYSLSINAGCRIEIDPESDECKELHKWFEGERPTIEIKSISTQANSGSSNFVDELRLFSFFTNPNLFIDEKGIYFNNIGVVTQIRSDNALYMSCANGDCSKKVTQNGSIYQCAANHSSTEYKYRYMVSMEISDICSTTWITLFNDKAEPFFGKTAMEMGELQQSNAEGFKAILNSKVFAMHNFRCRGKNDTYNDVSRIKHNVFEIRQPNFEQYGIALDAAIKKLEAL